jgi:formate hydrogenlyase subunit 3/multisubunit Na+/H+ antiporter MnhD subunit
MILWSGPFLPLAALIWPLLLGLAVALPPVRAHALRLLPLAPLPALALALMGQSDETAAPILLLGVRLAMDESTRLLLGMTAGLWLAAGIFAQSMAGGRNLALFAGFWCLTLTGNLGVFLAVDVITFYAAFAAVSLAAWFLVVHDRTSAALRAGRIYIVLAVLGEVCLMVAFLIGAQAADSLLIADIRMALAETPLGAVAVALLVVGFGIKAGMVPLHIWLPLAHPAAPVAASAVLSGAIVKAGLVGFWLFLPPGTFAVGLVALGLAGAFGAALWGLTQANPKAVLAYSTISQMGLMLALTGGGAAPQGVAFYAVHHGFAKGALFLVAGAVMGSAGRARMLLLGVAGVLALSVIGLPLTGGGAVKAAAKSGLSEGLALAITASGTTTALILGWFLWRLGRSEAVQSTAAVPQRVSVVILAIAAVLGPWLLWPQAIGLAPAYAVSASAVYSGLWPLALAVGLALALRLMRHDMPQLSRGKLFDGAGFDRLAGWRFSDGGIRPLVLPALALAPRVSDKIFLVEQSLKRWRWSGVGVVTALLVLTLAMR